MKWIKKNITSLDERQLAIPGSMYEIDNYTSSDAKLPHIQNLETVADDLTDRLVSDNLVIVGDYDCDGIMSTGIVLKAFRFLAEEAQRISGAAATPVSIIIPDREQDGYGFSKSHASGLHDSTILLLDNGIVQFDAIIEAKKNGNHVIVVDHHEPGNRLPDADIIVNPHAVAGGEFDNYCAAGLAYRLVRSMFAKSWVIESCNQQRIASLLDEFLFMAALATVADVVPVLWENRVMIREGMRQIPEHWKELCDCLLDNEKDALNEGDIAYKIAPALNAVGRMGELTPEFVEELIMSDDISVVSARAQYLNGERKRLTKTTMKAITIQNTNAKVLVVQDNRIPSGIAGIIAGSLADRYHKPVFVFSAEKDGMITGSARAEKGLVHLKNQLDKISQITPDLLVRYGGHEAAAGVTLPVQRLAEFTNLMNSITDYKPIQEKYYDFDLTDDDDWFEVYEYVSRYAPYGEGNPAPILHFHIKTDEKSVKIMSKDHIRIQNGVYEAVGFYMAKRANLKVYEYDLFGSLQLNEYMGSRRIQLNIEDFVQPPAQEEAHLTPFAQALAQCV